jgi:phenylalanyl-tRNA synthetase alpha chain
MTDDLRTETEAALAAATDLRAWDAVRVGVLGKSGKLTTLLKELGRASADERRERGAALNRLKDDLTAAIEARRAELEEAALDARLARERIDVTLPPRPAPAGLIHPISRTMEEMAAIFGAMGFAVGEGLDVQTDWFNFGALNIPAHHPARADHDTFYVPGTAGRCCCARRPRTCRSSPCWPTTRRCGSSRPAAPIAPITTPRTARCSTSARAWRSTATSRSAT